MARKPYSSQSVHCNRAAAAKALEALADQYGDRIKSDLIEAAFRFAADNPKDFRSVLDAVVTPASSGGRKPRSRTGTYRVTLDLVDQDRALATLIGSQHTGPDAQLSTHVVVFEAALRFGLHVFRHEPDLASRMIRWEHRRRADFVRPKKKAQRNSRPKLSVALGMTERTRSKGFEVSLDDLPESLLGDSPERHLR